MLEACAALARNLALGAALPLLTGRILLAGLAGGFAMALASLALGKLKLWRWLPAAALGFVAAWAAHPTWWSTFRDSAWGRRALEADGWRWALIAIATAALMSILESRRNRAEQTGEAKPAT